MVGKPELIQKGLLVICLPSCHPLAVADTRLALCLKKHCLVVDFWLEKHWKQWYGQRDLTSWAV